MLRPGGPELARSIPSAYPSRIMAPPLLPTALTLGSVFCSTGALIAIADQGHAGIPAACAWVALAATFDLLDGRVARWTHTTSRFGLHLDALSDLLAFGVVPAVIGWAWGLSALGVTGQLVVFGWIAAVAVRLARFQDDEVSAASPVGGHARGLPSTAGGLAVAAAAWSATTALPEVPVPPWALAAGAAILSLAMLSSWPVRTFRDLRESATARRVLAAVLAAGVLTATAVPTGAWLAAMVGAYLLAVVIELMVAALVPRRQASA